MADGRPVSPEVLAEKIDNLEDRLNEYIELENAFRIRIEGKLDHLPNVIARLQTQVDVNRTSSDSKHQTFETWQVNHTTFHERKEKETLDQSQRTMTFVAAVTGIVTAVGTISGAIVALLIR